MGFVEVVLSHKKLYLLHKYLFKRVDEVAREHRPHPAVVAESAVVTPVKSTKYLSLIYLALRVYEYVPNIRTHLLV